MEFTVNTGGGTVGQAIGQVTGMIIQKVGNKYHLRKETENV